MYTQDQTNTIIATQSLQQQQQQQQQQSLQQESFVENKRCLHASWLTSPPNSASAVSIS